MAAPVTRQVKEAVAWVKGLSRRQFFVLIGVWLMSTLFAGTAFFYSTIGPSGGSSAAPSAESTPPTGQTVRQASDIPRVGNQLPDQQVLSEPLTADEQVHLLGRHFISNQNQAVLLQYNCPDSCPALASNLTAVAENYPGWVYVAPYEQMEERIAFSAFRRPVRMDSFDRARLDQLICTSLANQPLGCVFGGDGGNQSNRSQ